MTSQSLLCSLLITTSVLSACAEDRESLQASVVAHEAALREIPRDFYRPSLGDQMNALQLRHAKLWFAGEAANWPLATFELEELEETLERVARWHADNKEIPMAPSIKAYTQQGRYAVAQSIAKQSTENFVAAFDRLTDGCNQCHHAAHHGFIVIGRPSSPPTSNQKWAPSAD